MTSSLPAAAASAARPAARPAAPAQVELCEKPLFGEEGDIEPAFERPDLECELKPAEGKLDGLPEAHRRQILAEEDEELQKVMTQVSRITKHLCDDPPRRAFCTYPVRL